MQITFGEFGFTRQIFDVEGIINVSFYIQVFFLDLDNAVLYVKPVELSIIKIAAVMVKMQWGCTPPRTPTGFAM